MKIIGLTKLTNKVDRLVRMDAVKAGVQEAGLLIKGRIAKYPPPSEANMPRTLVVGGSTRILPWYERGYGTRYPGGGGRKTSEMLGRKWAVHSKNNGMTAIVGNNASYAPFVQGEDTQAWFHRKRNWKTDKQVLEESKGDILSEIQVSVRNELAK